MVELFTNIKSMSYIPTILSTKELTIEQTDFLEKIGFSVTSIDFITTNSLNFKIQQKPTLLLFTSQNAIKSILNSIFLEELKPIPVICVGLKTKNLLEKEGFYVLAYTDYAEQLALKIIDNYSIEKIAFFAGNIRRNTLPDAMNLHQISFIEYTVYETIETSHIIDFTPEIVLFYSPSGVRSYLKNNQIKNSKAICIGTTTAEALQEITDNIFISEIPTVESVLEKCKSI